MARVREARLKAGEKGPPSGIQIFLQGALAKLGATLVWPQRIFYAMVSQTYTRCASCADLMQGVTSVAGEA